MTNEPRAKCLRCLRPQSVCYCHVLPTLPTATRVVILQHPRERDMAIGTARMARLCLPSAELHVGVDWSARDLGLDDPARPAILLYPGPDARDILTDPPVGPVTLVVVDGTWPQAKNVVRDNPVLRALPRYAFAAPEPSHYRIRREPTVEYCSTIEALMHVLGALEGDPERFRAMLAPFHAMIDAQIEAQATRPSHRLRNLKPRAPLRERLPPALRDRYADLVCITGESNSWPYHSGKASLGDELVHWVALRPSTGERFERIAAPMNELSPSTPFHTDLAEATLRAGGTRAELVDAFTAFIRPTDIIAAWGFFGFNLFRGAGGTLPPCLDLRTVAQRLVHRRLGTLEEFAATYGEPQAPLGAGRNGRRLAAVAQIVAAWRAL
ncbi:MAG: tRNA-uridine aminocarboxypropyltransferase [Kofleriaceae bacterium]